MINLNQQTREEHGILSLDCLQSILFHAQSYQCENISDFYEHEGEIKTTPIYTLSFDTRKFFGGKAALWLPSCTYHYLGEVDHKKVKQESKEKHIEIERLHKLEQKNAFSKKGEEMLNEKAHLSCILNLQRAYSNLANGELYDPTGVVRVRSRYTIQPGQKIEVALIAYHPLLRDLELLTHLDHHDINNIRRKKEKKNESPKERYNIQVPGYHPLFT